MSRYTCELNIEEMQAQLLKFIPNLSACDNEKFIKYYQLLIEWNKRINLTAITDPQGVASRHFADSLLSISMIPQGAKVIDIGTGAGFPGIPIKIMRPDIKLTLLDSLNKRIIFLNSVLDELNIEAHTLHLRAEDGAKLRELRESFDIVTSRAVANASKIAEWTVPFVKVGGSSLLYKGPGIEDELKDAVEIFKKLHVNMQVHHFKREWGDRCIVELKKY